RAAAATRTAAAAVTTWRGRGRRVAARAATRIGWIAHDRARWDLRRALVVVLPVIADDRNAIRADAGDHAIGAAGHDEQDRSKRFEPQASRSSHVNLHVRQVRRCTRKVAAISTYFASLETRSAFRQRMVEARILVT